MNVASSVTDTIRRRPGVRIPRGEFMVDHGFARDYLRWQTGSAAADRFPEAQLLVEFCRAANLDIVCLHASPAAQQAPVIKIKPAEIKSASAKNLFVFWVVNGAFQTAMMTQGVTAFLSEIVRSPDDVRSRLNHFSARAIDIMAQGVRNGAHGIIIADDIAYHRSTYTSPQFVEYYLLPVWQAQVSAARDLGVPVFLHSDGNLDSVLPMIVAAGFDGLQCIEPAAGMRIGPIKEKYGRNLCLMGNIDPAILFAPAEPADLPARRDRLRREVRHRRIHLRHLQRPAGGYVSRACPIDVPAGIGTGDCGRCGAPMNSY